MSRTVLRFLLCVSVDPMRSDSIPLYRSPGRSDNDVKNRWNLVCRRERAAEKNLQRASSNAAAGSSKSGGSAGPGGGNSNGNGNDTAGNSGGGGGGEGGGSSSGGSSEATPGRESPKGAAGSTSSPAASGDTDPRVEEDGNPPGPDESTGSTRTRSPDSDGVQEGGAARLSSSRGAAKAVKMEERATAAASTSTAKERGERGLRDEKPRVSVEDPSVIEAREAAEAGAGLVKVRPVLFCFVITGLFRCAWRFVREVGGYGRCKTHKLVPGVSPGPATALHDVSLRCFPGGGVGLVCLFVRQ